MGSTLFRNPIVITQNENREVLRADVLVEGNRILETGKHLEGDSVIDADSMILMPGLLNTHTHVAMTHMRGSLDDIILSQLGQDDVIKGTAHMRHRHMGVRVQQSRHQYHGVRIYHGISFQVFPGFENPVSLNKHVCPQNLAVFILGNDNRVPEKC